MNQFVALKKIIILEPSVSISKNISMHSCTLSVKHGYVCMYGDDSIGQDKGVICSSGPCQRFIPYSVL